MIFVILLIFPISGNKWKKKFNYNEKKNFCAEKLNFGLLPKYIERLGSWAGRWARLLGVQALGARGALRRACVGARARAQVGAGALGHAGRSWQAGGRRAGAGKCADTGGRGARDRRRLGRRAGRARQGAAAGASARAAVLAGRWARGLSARAGLGQCTRCTRPIFDPF